ncbi:MAG: tetratricopeptide repeat protein, partial [Chthoniobacteraceae bacterium]
NSSPKNVRVRLAMAALAIGAALVAALVLKTPPPQAAPRPVAVEPLPVARGADEILALLPEPDATSPSGKVMAAGIAQVRKTPENAVGWVTLGDLLAQRQRDSADPKYYDFAELAYEHALGLQPRSAGAMSGMAWVTGGRHVFDESTRWAEKALAVDPGNAAAVGILGDAAVELGDYDQAFEHYQKMMDLRPDLSSWSRGAHLLWITGEKDRAMSLMERAIKAGAPFAENTAWCRAKLAMMLFHDGKLDAAEQVLEPALAASSRNIHVLLAAGRIAAALQDFSAARKHYETILESGPNHEALAALGDLCAQSGEADAAEKYYAQVEVLHASGAAHDHVQMAKFYADHDRKLVDALRLAEQHKLTRNVLEADTLAWVYFKNGDQPRAAEAVKRALSRGTPDAEMHFHAGMIAAAAGDRVSAQQHLQQALNLNPRFSVLLAPIAAKTLDELRSAKSAVTASP